MKRCLYLLTCILFIFCSCKKEIKIRKIVVEDSLFQTIPVDPRDIENLKEPAKISKIAVDLEYIPLQTGDSILIGKIKKLIVYNEKYYIWDSLTETIFCFDENGSYSHKIHRVGHGPKEYPRISDFTMDMNSGNICIYSDMTKAINIYTEKGDFLSKNVSSLILSSFAVNNDFIYCYAGALPNKAFYSEDYPNQYRYIVMENGEYKHQQLNFTYNEKYNLIPLSSENFSFYKDTTLLIECLEPKVYTIDSIGCLQPKYNIRFLTNTYSPSFNSEVDLEKMKTLKENGKLATLTGSFYENDNYLFFNYAWGIIGSVYVNKKDGSIHNMGYMLADDFNNNALPISIDFVDEEYIYKIVDPSSLIRRDSKTKFSPYLKKIVDGLEEFDNPIIIKIKLKQ